MQKNNKSVKYIALGGSLSAGVCNGGIYEDSQLAAFPNLIAKQMGVTGFKNPLFEGPFKNGTGYLTASVKNKKLVFTKRSESIFSKGERLPKVKEHVDNLAVPYLKVREIGVKRNEPGAFLPLFDNTSYDHLNRYLDENSEGHLSYSKVIQKAISGKKIDFFTWEMGMDDFTSYFSNGAYGQPISFVTSDREGYFPENALIRALVAAGAKGAVANVPEVLSLPYYRFYSAHALADSQIYVQRFGKNDVRLLDERDILLPTEGVAALLTNESERGRTRDNPLLDEEVIGYEEQISVTQYNQWIADIAKENNLPLVDLHSLYAKILKGDYVTEDGLKIDPAYPSGNFFSADGIHPSAIGQAVIANEFIRTINSFHSTHIPFLSVK